MISLKDLTILIVDDEADIRDIIACELTFFGATTLEADNVTAAIKLLKTQRCDVVISDIRMAGENALDLINKINNELTIKPKLFLCTGFNDINKETAHSLGVIEIFEKPFNIEKMVQSIAQALLLVP